MKDDIDRDIFFAKNAINSYVSLTNNFIDRDISLAKMILTEISLQLKMLSTKRVICK